jgi:Predicted flavin-nucleotide-binding protein
LLSRIGFGRLACVANNRPYIVPIYFSYDAERLYCFSTLGQKIEWMRENPLVCIEVDEVLAHDNWRSVVAMGHYLEFSNASKDAKGREYVRSLIEKRTSVVAKRLHRITSATKAKTRRPDLLLHSA